MRLLVLPDKVPVEPLATDFVPVSQRPGRHHSQVRQRRVQPQKMCNVRGHASARCVGVVHTVGEVPAILRVVKDLQHRPLSGKDGLHDDRAQGIRVTIPRKWPRQFPEHLSVACHGSILSGNGAAPDETTQMAAEVPVPEWLFPSDSVEAIANNQGAIIRSPRLIWRVFRAAPATIKALMVAYPALFVLSLILAAVKLPFWAAVIPINPAGGALFSLGLCYFRDLRETATIHSRLYKEAKGIAPDGFTMADVPTIKGMGFFYMVLGTMLVLGSVWTITTSFR